MESLSFDYNKNTTIKDENNEINELGLKERKQKVIKELKNNNLIIEQLNNLLLFDNTNEDLICRYILSFNKDAAKRERSAISNNSKFFNNMGMKETDVVNDLIIKSSNYISINKLKELKKKIFGDSNKGYRNVSFKSILFELLSALKNDDIDLLKTNLGKLNAQIKLGKKNNQPFDTNNFEALYFYFCTLFSTQIEKNKESKNYFEFLKIFISKIKEIDEFLKDESNENEKKDFKKFLIIIFAILNLDTYNFQDISQVVKILNPPNNEEKKMMISVVYKDIKFIYGVKKAEEFIKKIEGNNNYCSLNYIFVENELELSEKSYLYDYIIQNNIFKKYEKQIINLLNIIFKSDLIKQLLRAVYGEDYKRIEPILEKEYSVENFWNNVILFVPFKIGRISGFTYRDIFKIFISIYKFNHFKTNLENEIFTLGAFVRTLAHESLGDFIVSYIFFMFYANIENSKEREKHYIFPRIQEKIKKLDKKNYIELIGNTLAKIEIDIINNENNKVKEKEDKNEINLNKTSKLLIKEYDEILEKKIFEEFKKIIGNDYAKILSHKLIERKKNEIEIQTNKKKQGKSINNFQNIELEQNSSKDNILLKKSEEIIDILFQCLSEDFEKVIQDLESRQEEYKSNESGNLIEILLFNDFSQYMTLKECLFLLDEENYKNTNLFKFRSEFKSISRKNNEAFLKDLKTGNKIFKNLFSQYYSIYGINKYVKQDFITPKTFKENNNNNLIKNFGSFKCYNVKIDDSMLPDEPDF